MDWATSVATARWASRKHRSACARKRSASVIPITPAFMCHFAHKSWRPNPHGDLTFHFCKTVTHADTYGTDYPARPRVHDRRKMSLSALASQPEAVFELGRTARRSTTT